MKKSFLILVLLFIIVLLNAKGVGLVLSGGGSRALAQIGVLKVLDSLNVKIDYIAGTIEVYLSARVPERHRRLPNGGSQPGSGGPWGSRPALPARAVLPTR